MMNFEGIQDLGGASVQNETQAPEEKVVNLEEQKKKRQPFAYWNVGGRSFKMKLKASGMSPWEHGIDYQDVQKLYDAWIDEGNSQLELYQKILIPLMVVSGFLPEKTAASLLEEIENA